ncbi:MAG: trehalose-6-phosphate synthase, partial [Bifidobacteriaceae bacterium]|nr:trehalose-6-phosphate synthase [Bifidobacteriaceae bacterium]
MTETKQFDMVVVANRLPVDIHVDDDGQITSRRSPGGLVAALEPALQAAEAAWVGWVGAPDLEIAPFVADGIHQAPVPLSGQEVQDYYEGFANSTIWPLYHDVITPPMFHREWAESYRQVNHRFALHAAKAAASGATVWVHDYQLQLVPRMLRAMRPDLRIGFFLHIPFPDLGLFTQLPWRRLVLEGLLGADLIGFQRASDAANFRSCVRHILGITARGQSIQINPGSLYPRTVRAAPFPISIDFAAMDQMARKPSVQRRALAIRAELGDPQTVFFGADRLDYTKGIRHRLKAYSELLDEGRLEIPGTVMVQVASPTRDNVEAYQMLRDDVETTVGRINGDHSTLGRSAVQYLHQSQSYEEMVALFLAADVLLITALRDGMNLVAKEYPAARCDRGGVLILSEFAGAADELTQALIVNPHDIDQLKSAMVRAATMPIAERRRRMAALRRRVRERDVTHWTSSFLNALGARWVG